MLRPPIVSIIIPVHNGSNFLREAIDSALAQDYPHCEVLVINDGSCDNGATGRIALSYGNRIRYFTKENGGVASALNMGIAKMDGEFFSWLSHDDLYLPDKCRIQLDFWLQCHDEKCIVYSDADHIDAKDMRTRHRSLPDIEKASLLHIWGQSFLNGCAMLIPRVLLLEQKGFKEDLRMAQDYEMWLRLATTATFRHLPEVVLLSRQHAEQDSKMKSELHHQECMNLFKSYVPKLIDYAKEENGDIRNAVPVLAGGIIQRTIDYGFYRGRDLLREFKSEMSPDEWRELCLHLFLRFPAFFTRFLWSKTPEHWRKPVRAMIYKAKDFKAIFRSKN